MLVILIPGGLNRSCLWIVHGDNTLLNVLDKCAVTASRKTAGTDAIFQKPCHRAVLQRSYRAIDSAVRERSFPRCTIEANPILKGFTRGVFWFVGIAPLCLGVLAHFPVVSKNWILVVSVVRSTFFESPGRSWLIVSAGVFRIGILWCVFRLSTACLRIDRFDVSWLVILLGMCCVCH